MGGVVGVGVAGCSVWWVWVVCGGCGWVGGVVGVVGCVWVHVYSPCIKTDSHCYMHHWSVFMLTTAGDGSGVGGGSERGGEDEDILTDQQAELIPGQSLDEVIDSETLGRLQLRSCVWLCVWWVVGVVGWVVWWVWWVWVVAYVLSMH